MAHTPEKKVKIKVTTLLKSYGVYFFSPVTGGYGSSGVPDIICCVNGLFLAIECKAGKGKTTALQDLNIARIRKCGGIALVINELNIDELSIYLDNLTNVRQERT
jgi:Holliday junction resolvase